jgi:hypothetical protein
MKVEITCGCGDRSQETLNRKFPGLGVDGLWLGRRREE